MTNKAKAKETFGKAVFEIAAVICIIAVIAIFAFLIIKSVPAFNKLGIFGGWCAWIFHSRIYCVFLPAQIEKSFFLGYQSACGNPVRCLRIFRYCVLTSVTIQHCTQQRKRITRNLNHTWYYDLTDRCIAFKNKY